MGESQAEGAHGSTGCVWGCLTLLALGLLSLVLGFELVGKLCIFLVFAAALVRALRDRSLPWAFGGSRLARDSQPFAFWSLVALDGAFMLLALWMLVDEIRQGTG